MTSQLLSQLSSLYSADTVYEACNHYRHASKADLDLATRSIFKCLQVQEEYHGKHAILQDVLSFMRATEDSRFFSWCDKPIPSLAALAPQPPKGVHALPPLPEVAEEEDEEEPPVKRRKIGA